jgi:hypothetical protein
VRDMTAARCWSPTTSSTSSDVAGTRRSGLPRAPTTAQRCCAMFTTQLATNVMAAIGPASMARRYR